MNITFSRLWVMEKREASARSYVLSQLRAERRQLVSNNLTRNVVTFLIPVERIKAQCTQRIVAPVTEQPFWVERQITSALLLVCQKGFTDTQWRPLEVVVCLRDALYYEYPISIAQCIAKRGNIYVETCSHCPESP